MYTLLRMYIATKSYILYYMILYYKEIYLNQIILYESLQICIIVYI